MQHINLLVTNHALAWTGDTYVMMAHTIAAAAEPHTYVVVS